MLLLAALAVAIHLPGILFGSHRRVLRPEEMAPGVHATLPSDQPVDLQAEGATNQVVLVPALAQAGHAVEQGAAPLWNPYSRLGEPFSFSGAPVWYPPYWLLMADLGGWALDLVLALHSLLACIGMFRFLRVMPLSRYSAFFGGGVYGLGWFMTASLDRLPEAAAAALLPFALECTWRCLSTRRQSHLFVTALAGLFALMFATGSTTTAWLGVTLCAAMLLAGFTAIEREHRGVALRFAGAATACTALLTAPLWLEWWQFASATQPLSDSGRGPLAQPMALLGGLAPGIFTDLRGSGAEILRDVNPGADPLELTLYPGAAVLFLLVLGLMRPKRSFQELFWLLVAGGGLVLAIHNPIHEFLDWRPSRAGAALILFHVGAIVLASISLETFMDNPLARRHATPIACAIVWVATGFVVTAGWVLPKVGDAAVTWIAGRADPILIHEARDQLFGALLHPMIAMSLLAIAFSIWRRYGILRFKPVLAAIALAELMLIAVTEVPRGNGEIEGERFAVAIPAPQSTGGRVFSVGRGPELRVTPLGFSQPRPPGSWLASAGPHRVLDTQGRAILRRTAELVSAVDPSVVRTARARAYVAPLLVPDLLDHPLLELASIEVAPSNAFGRSHQFEPLTATPGAAVPDPGGVLVATNPRPRVRIVYRSDLVEQEDAAVARLRDGAAMDTDSVLLEGLRREFEPKRPVEPHQVEIVEDSPNRVRIHANLHEGRGYLVLADAFAPGWTATVDGAPTELAPGHVALRAVALREGAHEIEFRYQPWSWSFGLPLALAGGILALAYGLLSLRFARR